MQMISAKAGGLAVDRPKSCGSAIVEEAHGRTSLLMDRIRRMTWYEQRSVSSQHRILATISLSLSSTEVIKSGVRKRDGADS